MEVHPPGFASEPSWLTPSDQREPLVSMFPEFRWGYLLAYRMPRVVGHHLRMAIQAQRYAVVGFIGAPVRLLYDMVYVHLIALVLMA